MSPVRKAADDSASCQAVRDAIEQGAGTWREVATLTGLSHEWARQLGMRMDVRPVKLRRRSKQAPRPPWNSPHIVERFWEQVEVNGPPAFGFAEPTRCWMWRGKTNAEGYGVLSVGRFRVSAHRYSYRLHHGRKPWSIVDHLCHSYSRDCRGGPSCRHRLCMNPAHFEVVTPTESSRRVPGNRVYSAAPPRLFAWCPNGHAWNLDDALYDGAGRRVCVWCVTGTEPPSNGE